MPKAALFPISGSKGAPRERLCPLVSRTTSGARLLWLLVVVIGHGRLGSFRRTDTVLLGGPSAEIDQLAPFGTERAVWILGEPCHLRPAPRAAYVPGAGHRLQKVNSNSTSRSTLRDLSSGLTDTNLTFSAYRFALISGTHAV
jgi:hypothetical protein